MLLSAANKLIGILFFFCLCWVVPLKLAAQEKVYAIDWPFAVDGPVYSVLTRNDTLFVGGNFSRAGYSYGSVLAMPDGKAVSTEPFTCENVVYLNDTALITFGGDAYYSNKGFLTRSALYMKTPAGGKNLLPQLQGNVYPPWSGRTNTIDFPSEFYKLNDTSVLAIGDMKIADINRKSIIFNPFTDSIYTYDLFPEPELITTATAKDSILVIGYQNGKVRIYVNTGAGYFIYRTIQSDGKIYDVLISGDTLWVAGSFKNIRAIPQSGIAAFDLQALSITMLSTPAITFPANGGVCSITVADSLLWFAGLLDSVGYQNLNAINLQTNTFKTGYIPPISLCWEDNNTLPWGSHQDRYYIKPISLYARAGKLYVASDFGCNANTNGQMFQPSTLARLNISSGNWDPSWRAFPVSIGSPPYIRKIVFWQNQIWVASRSYYGSKVRVFMLESVPRHNFVAFKLNPPRILDLQLPPRKYPYYLSAGWSLASSGYRYIVSVGNSSTDTIFSMALDKNILWIGGSSPDSLPTGLVGLDVQTGNVVTGVPSVNGKVYTVAAADTNIWVGGNFRSVNTDSVNGLVRLDPNTRTVKNWLPQSTAVNFPVKTLGLTPNRIWIGSPAGLGVFRTDSLQPANWFYPTDSEIKNISIQNNEVYVSGKYTTGLIAPKLSVIEPDDSLSAINYRLLLGSSIFPPFIGRPNTGFVINHNIDYFSVATKLNNSIITGGLFNLLQQKTRYNLAGFSLQKDDNYSSGITEPIIEDWNPDLNIKVIPNCLAVSGDTVWVGTNNSILGFRKCLKPGLAPIRVLGPSVFCKGDSVELRTGVTSNSLYWIVNNKHIPVGNGSIYIKENALVYLQDSSDCGIWTNKVPVQISVGNTYTVRLNTVSDTIVAVGGGANGSYRWYQSGELLAETTYPKIRASVSNGPIWCIFYDSLWCKSYSDTLLITNQLGYYNTHSTTKIYPNPATNQLYISGLLPNTDWKLISSSGAVVLSGIAEKNEIMIKLPDGISSGLYVFRIADTDIHKVIISR